MANETKVLSVEGMSCQHCVNSVNKAVGELPGVAQVAVDLKGKTVTVQFNPGEISIAAIKEAIEDQGYDVK